MTKIAWAISFNNIVLPSFLCSGSINRDGHSHAIVPALYLSFGCFYPTGCCRNVLSAPARSAALIRAVKPISSEVPHRLP
jgi:hypothetical protein